MSRKEFVLAALYSAQGGQFSPVQVQKLFFLIDKNIPHLISGAQFDFQPYNYGPFDKEVYEELQGLQQEGDAYCEVRGSSRSYRLTESGQRRAEQAFSSLPAEARSYIEQAVQFVRSLSFTQLVSAIYKAYPETRVNSVFQG